MLKVLGSTSTTTGFKPSKRITSIVEAKEKFVVITSSPLFNSRAIKAICSASVPLAHGITCFTSTYFCKLFWNSFTIGPLINVEELITFFISLLTCHRIFLY